MRRTHRGILALAPAALLAATALAAPPAHADVPTLQLGFHNGYCSTTELSVPADTPFNVDIDTSFQFTDQSEFRIPSLKIRIILPSAYFNPHARAEVAPQPRGSIPFELMTPTVSGSAGKGCWGTITVW
ncbi:cupredoxin domain-containing protein [Nocardia yamanashiensis]|uniref:cupredoxin domain-containing protein n=1 Tax=Nocardia yamanashiensis TaxID=209247 RepID=UPI001E2C4B72|nr:cupredoxin domain-containing protein [Nocardia yamanashiensis]UGT42596.1 cupredoxin domain-containing protein [Nocardia yamanashiensis]